MNEAYVFLLSGIYETLPKAELESTLAILDPGHVITETLDRVVVAETKETTAKLVVGRTAYTKLSARLLGTSPTHEKQIIESINLNLLVQLLPENSTIAVRGKRIGGASIDKVKVEGELGRVILRNIPGLRVNLRNPSHIIIFISHPEKTYIGLIISSKPKHFFKDRIAGRRPFTLPSAMQPDFSRCMVNLARARIGGRILDPFAGTGGIMIEAALLGYKVYGVELKEWIARGGLRNLKHYCPGREHMIVGDARKVMFRENVFEAVVTDPPYGRSTVVPERSFLFLVGEFLSSLNGLLVDDGRVVMASPEEYDVEDIASAYGFKVAEVHKAKVHGSLVRKVVVME